MSREVPPPADKPGIGETHDAVEAHEAAEPGMDLDVIEDRNDDHTDLDSLMAVLTKDAWKEITEANDEIMGVIRSLGGNGRKYIMGEQKVVATEGVQRSHQIPSPKLHHTGMKSEADLPRH